MGENYYKREIIKMIEEIENKKMIESIYWFVKTIYEKYRK